MPQSAVSTSVASKALVFCAAAWLALLSVTANAGPSFPPRKAGLWEMRIAGNGGPAQGMVMQQCVDSATDKSMQDYGNSQPKMNRKFCKEELRSEVGRMLVHRTTCKEGTDSVITHVVVTGDFDAGYRVQSTTTYEPPRKAAKTDGDMVMDAKWLGACTGGLKPGDMVMPGGMKMNIVDMLKMMPAAPR